MSLKRKRTKESGFFSLFCNPVMHQHLQSFVTKNSFIFHGNCLAYTCCPNCILLFDLLCQQKCYCGCVIIFFCFIFTLPDWLSTKTIDGGKGMSFLSQICRESSDNPLSYLPFLCCLHFLCCM